MKETPVFCIGCGHEYGAPRCMWPIACVRCSGDAAPFAWWAENGTAEDFAAIRRYLVTKPTPVAFTRSLPESASSFDARILKPEGSQASGSATPDLDLRDLIARLSLLAARWRERAVQFDNYATSYQMDRRDEMAVFMSTRSSQLSSCADELKEMLTRSGESMDLSPLVSTRPPAEKA